MKSALSYVQLMVTGLKTERFINILVQNDIKLYNVKKRDEGTYVKLNTVDYRKIKEAVRITGVRTKIMRKQGMGFFFFRNRKRYFFAAGLLVFIAANILLSDRIYKISITGNTYYSDREIYEFLQTVGVEYGKHTKNINCSFLEDELRKRFPEISWISVNTEGSRLNVSIKEEENAVIPDYDEEPCDLIAEKDGEVYEIIVRTGTPMVKKGDMVEKGKVLVSSKVEYTGFYGENFGCRYVHSDADIKIKCINDYYETVNRKYEIKEYTGRIIKIKGIKLFNMYMDDGNGQCEFERYDVETVYEKVQYDMYGFPVTYYFQTYREYRLVEKEYSDDELKERAGEKMNDYLHNLEEKGIQTGEKSVNIHVYGESAVISGTITTIEPAYITGIPEKDDETET